MTDEVIEAALRRDRAIVAGALFVLAGLALGLRAVARRPYGHERHGHVRLSARPAWF